MNNEAIKPPNVYLNTIRPSRRTIDSDYASDADCFGVANIEKAAARTTREVAETTGGTWGIHPRRAEGGLPPRDAAGRERRGAAKNSPV